MIEQDRELPELPKGWVQTDLGEVLLKLSSGISQRQVNSGIPVTRIETISKGTIDLERVGYLANLPSETIQKYRLIHFTDE